MFHLWRYGQADGATQTFAQLNMKSINSLKKFPTTAREWSALLQDAPGESSFATEEQEAQWSAGVLIKAGGHKAVREALLAKRKSASEGDY